MKVRHTTPYSKYKLCGRKLFWSKKESIIGRTVEVKYKEITKDKKTGLESLQFPIFIRLREIGKCVSYD